MQADGFNHITAGQPFGACIAEATPPSINMGSGDTFTWPASSAGAPVTVQGWLPQVTGAVPPTPLNYSIFTDVNYFDCYFTAPTAPGQYVSFTCQYDNASSNETFYVTSASIIVDAPTVTPDPSGGYVPYLSYQTGAVNQNQTQIGVLQPALATYSGQDLYNLAPNNQNPNVVVLCGAADGNGGTSFGAGFYNDCLVQDPPGYTYSSAPQGSGESFWVQLINFARRSFFTDTTDSTLVPSPIPTSPSTLNPTFDAAGLDGPAFPYSGGAIVANGTTIVSMNDSPGTEILAFVAAIPDGFGLQVDDVFYDYQLYIPAIPSGAAQPVDPVLGPLWPIYVPIEATTWECHGGSGFTPSSSPQWTSYAEPGGAIPCIDSNTFLSASQQIPFPAWTN